MNNILLYNNFINEKYSTTMLKGKYYYGDVYQYIFTNRDNIKFGVNFREEGKGKYKREYYVKHNNKHLYDILNTGDAFNILKTVTNVTLDFIDKVQPKQIVIEHIPTDKEIADMHEQGMTLEDYTTKRALINKRYLEKRIPKNYNYKLLGSFSYIIRK